MEKTTSKSCMMPNDFPNCDGGGKLPWYTFQQFQSVCPPHMCAALLCCAELIIMRRFTRLYSIGSVHFHNLLFVHQRSRVHCGPHCNCHKRDTRKCNFARTNHHPRPYLLIPRIPEQNKESSATNRYLSGRHHRHHSDRVDARRALDASMLWWRRRSAIMTMTTTETGTVLKDHK